MARDRARLSLALRALFAVALLAASRSAAAADETVVEVKDPLVRVRAELDLFLNGAPAGTSIVVLERGDALVLPSDLERAGLALRGGTRVTVDDRELVSLQSLAPAIRFVVDERGLALRITAAPELLGRHVLDLSPRPRPADFELRSDRSAFLDYAADSDLAGHVGLAFEAGGRVGSWLATGDVRRDMLTGRWIRGQTSANRDDVPRLERWTVGDAVATTGPLGGSALVGGIAFGRELSLDPYTLHAPRPSSTAIVTAPSTLDVYVNGALVRQQTLAPGYWDLSNLPATSGQTQVRTVVRDAFGRERVLDNRFYFSSGLLTPGFADYGVAAGLVRENFGVESWEYGSPAATARYRVGVTDWFTPGLRVEASRDVVSGGGSATTGSPWGEVEATASASGAHGEAGAAGQLTWSWIAARFSGGVQLLAQSARYANLSLTPASDRPLLDASASAGINWSRFGLGTTLHAGRYRDLGTFGTAGLTGSLQLGGGLSLGLSADYGKTVGGPTGLQLLALLSWGFKGHSADVGVTRDRDGRTTGSASMSRPLTRDDGLGYRVHATGDNHATQFDGALQGQTSFGRAELDVFGASNGTTSYHANASGGVVYVGRRVYLSRPTQSGYALVDAGLPGVGVTLENALVGSTGTDGTLLVTELQPYYASKIGIRDRDLPVEYEPGRTERWIATALRGGAVVAFDVRRISAITGQLTVRLHGQDQRPANGELSAIVDGELRTSPITEDGRFFLERMPPGKHVVQAIWGGGSCRAAITLPAGAPPVLDAGEIRCIADVLEPGGRIPKLTDPGYADGAFPPDLEKGAGAGGP